MNEFHEEDEEVFCRFTFGQFVSLALLELVALFFVFYLGARYGPGLLGHKSESTEKKLSDAQVEEVFEVSKTPSGQVRYTFPETLTRKEVEVAATPATKPVPIKQPTIAKPETQPAIVPETPPIPKMQPPTGSGYAIQVGSYRQANGAAEKVNQWQAKGYDAFLSIGEVPNSGTWYRVRIGSFKSREGARIFLEQLTNKEKVSAIIVRSSS